MDDPSPRARWLRELYAEADADWAAAELDRLVAARPVRPQPSPDETSAWVIAYPDHISAQGVAPLAALDALLADELAPWITGVHTLPLHPSSSDGGFAVVDTEIVDPAVGDWSDVERMATTRTWLADLVVNHLSASSPWFRRFLDGDPMYADFFVRLPDGVDTSAVVRPRTSPLAHSYPSATGEERVWTTFSPDQVDLDYRNPRVLVAIAEVLARYVDHGAGAIRLDAVPFLWKDPATTSVHLPPTHTIVAILGDVLRSLAPGAVLVTETNVPERENRSYFGRADRPEADAVYQFPLPPLVAHAATTGDAAPLTAWARTLAAPRPATTFLNVLATHDGIGLRPAEGLLAPAAVAALARRAAAAGGVVNERATAEGDRPYELAVSWFALMSAGVSEEVALARHLATHAIALALPGIPLLYTNSLFAVANDVATYERTGHGRDLNRRRLTRAEIDGQLADPVTVAARCWCGLRRMLDARRRNPAFHPRAGHRVLDAPEGTLAIERIGLGASAVVIVELAGTPTTVALPPGRWRDLDGISRHSDVTVGPHAVAWLHAERTVTPGV